jgi:plasmid stabilization system protein ParE
MNYSFHSLAEKELEEIENYYDNISQELGDRFRAEFELSLSRILTFPKLWHPLAKTVRRRRLNSFPYGIIYRVKPDEIRILTVMHLHRRPNYWRDRK